MSLQSKVEWTVNYRSTRSCQLCSQRPGEDRVGLSVTTYAGFRFCQKHQRLIRDLLAEQQLKALKLHIRPVEPSEAPANAS